MTERLTKKTDEGIWVKESHGENVMKTLYQCYGAEPLPNYSNCDEGYCGMEKLAEYETAEEEGRLVILPKCNIGDTVYLPIDFQNKIYTGTVDGYEYSPRRKKWVVKIITDDGEKCYEAFDDFGKTFFIDVEDAAKMLKEMKK